MSKLSYGYTLLEMLATIALVGILVGIGVPSFKNLINGNSQTSGINTFIGSLQAARSEAVKRSRQITLCPSTDKSRCNFSQNWDAGWIAFIDTNQDTSRGVDEEVFIIENGFKDGYKLTGSIDVEDFIRFRADGFTRENGEFVMCDPRGSVSARSVILSISGKTRTSDTTLDGSALSCS